MTNQRVYEVAHELGLDSRAILAELNRMGSPAVSASSLLTPDQQTDLRQRLTDRSAQPAAPGAPQDSPARPVAPARSAESYRPKYIKADALPPLARMLAGHLIDKGLIQENLADQFRREARLWGELFLEPAEVRAWLDTGLVPDQARECQRLGLTLRQMNDPLTVPGKARAGGAITNREALLRGIANPQEIATQARRAA